MIHWLLPEAAEIVGANNQLMKSLKRKYRKLDGLGDLKNFNIFKGIYKVTEVCKVVHMPKFVSMLSSHLWLTLRLCTAESER